MSDTDVNCHMWQAEPIAPSRPSFTRQCSEMSKMMDVGNAPGGVGMTLGRSATSDDLNTANGRIVRPSYYSYIKLLVGSTGVM